MNLQFLMLEHLEVPLDSHSIAILVNFFFSILLQMFSGLKKKLEARFARNKQCAEFTRAWADEYFRVFPNRRYLSNTLTVIDARPKGCTERISIPQLNQALAERNLQLGNGYGVLKDATFRIAHMGELRLEDLQEITSAVVDVLHL